MKPDSARSKSRFREKIRKSDYERDFHAWLLSQVHALKDRRFRDLDLENLIEEVGDLARSLSRELRNRLRVILVHLLKWQYQSSKRSTSWRVTLVEQRDQIAQLLEESPSLYEQLPNLIEKAYPSATKRAGVEMQRGKIRHIFPAHCPWTIEQILDDEFVPNGAKSRPVRG